MVAFIIPRRRKPSFKNGFARSARTALYPSLRKGLVVSLVAPLGPTGAMLRDVCGRRNHGTLTNMDPATDWVAGKYGYALDFDGDDDYISLPDFSSLFSDRASIVFFLARDVHTPIGEGETGISRFSTLGGSNSSLYPWTDGVIYDGTFRTSRVTGTTGLLSDRTIPHQMAVTTKPGASGWNFWQNAQIAFSATGDSSVNMTTTPKIGESGSAAFNFKGRMWSIHIYSRVISPRELRVLYRDHLAPLRQRDEIAFFDSGGGGDWPPRSPIQDTDSGFTPGGIQPIDSGIAT